MASVTSLRKYVSDSFVNLVSMLGTTRDKAYHNQFAFTPMDRGQLEAAYRGDWVAKKIVNVPAGDSTRAWRDWQAESDQIEKIEGVERTFGVQSKLKSSLVKARLYGGGGLLMGFGDDPSVPLNPESIKAGSLKYLHSFAAHEMNASELIRDVNSPHFGLPEFYTVNGQNMQVRVHHSRVVRLVGTEIPDRSLDTGGWGDSVLQAVYDAVMNVASSTGGIASLIQESKIDVVKLPDFMKNMADPSYKSLVVERFALANQTKSMVSTLIMDKEEEWERITTSFTGLPDLMKLYLLVACGAADIPATRFLGQAASGLNASGAEEIRNYYDSIASYQTNELSPALAVLDEVLIRTALGSRPTEVYYEWAPLWQLDETQKAALAKTKAETTKIYSDTGLVEPEVLATVVTNQLTEDGTYPGIEAAMEEFEASGGGVDEDDPEVKEQFAKSKGEKPDEDVGETLPKIELKVVPGGKTVAKDAAPRTLYVRRDLLNADAVYKHYADQLGDDAGLLMDPAKWHVTVMYSRTPVDWIKVGDDYLNGDENGKFTVAPGGPRLHERLGENRDAVVLQFASSRLCWRHESMKESGCSFDFSEYQPHVTISWDPDKVIDAERLKPYRGALEFGPEIFEEIDEDWKVREGIEK